MNRLIPWRISFHLLIGLSLGTFLFWPGVTGLAHQTTAAKLKSETKKTSVTFEPPNENEPDNTVGGASRDGGGVCLAENASSLSPSTGELLPLTPLNNYGLTVADRPTFYAYLPSSDRVTKIFFNVHRKPFSAHQLDYSS